MSCLKFTDALPKMSLKLRLYFAVGLGSRTVILKYREHIKKLLSILGLDLVSVTLGLN